MSQAHSPIPQLATELNPKPTFAVGDILLNRRCDFYQVTRCDFRDSVQFPTILPHSRIGLARLWRRQATLARHITDRGAR